MADKDLTNKIINEIISGWNFYIGKTKVAKIAIINGTGRKWSLWVGDRCTCDSDDMNPLYPYCTYYHTFIVHNSFYGKSCHWARIYSEDEPKKYSGWFIFDHGAPWENNVYVIREGGIKRILPESKAEENVTNVSLFNNINQTGMREIEWLKNGCPKFEWPWKRLKRVSK